MAALAVTACAGTGRTISMPAARRRRDLCRERPNDWLPLTGARESST